MAATASPGAAATAGGEDNPVQKRRAKNGARMVWLKFISHPTIGQFHWEFNARNGAAAPVLGSSTGVAVGWSPLSLLGTGMQAGGELWRFEPIGKQMQFRGGEPHGRAAVKTNLGCIRTGD